MIKKFIKNIKMKSYVKNVKKRISKDEYPNFTSHQIIYNSGYVDFLFIGEYNDESVVWNSTLSTSRGDYYDTVEGKAMDIGYDKYPSEIDLDNMFKKIKGTKYYELIDPTPELSKARSKLIAEETIKLLNSKEISIAPWNIEIDETYRYGIGLHIRMDVPYFNVNDVEKFIYGFTIYGELLFDDYDNTPMSLTADELGVEFDTERNYVKWKDNFMHNTVGVKTF
jgi:hypothetical protein